MLIDKNFKGLVNVGWRSEYQGNIETTESLEVNLDMGLFVTQYIEACGSIYAGGPIKAGESIKAGEYIKAGGSSGISAGLYIIAKLTINCGINIYAGICTWRKIEDKEKTITCSKLENGHVEYGILNETGIVEKKKVTKEFIKEQPWIVQTQYIALFTLLGRYLQQLCIYVSLQGSL